MNLYEIRERLLSSGRAVFNMAQLSNLLGIPRDHAKVYASRLVERMGLEAHERGDRSN